MACGVTLKRSIDLDGLHSPDHCIKRRRTSNVCHHSPYQPLASGFASQQQHLGLSQSNSGHVQSEKVPTIFDTVTLNAKVNSDELYSFLRKELHLLRKRRVPNNEGFMASSSPTRGYVRGPDSPLSTASDSDGEQHQHSSTMDYNSGATVTNMAAASVFNNAAMNCDAIKPQVSSNGSLRDKPLFNFVQVRNICERLLKEQEIRLSNEYDKLLNAKLAEQHEAFVRFTYDQIHRRFEDAPMSYLS